MSRERPKIPAHLTTDQKAVWNSIVKDLEGNGILAQSDGYSIEMVATLIGTARECAKRIKVVGRWSDEGRKATDMQIKSLNAARPYVEQLALSPRGRHAIGMSVARAQGKTDQAKPTDPVTQEIGESPRLKMVRGGKAG